MRCVASRRVVIMTMEIMVLWWEKENDDAYIWR